MFLTVTVTVEPCRGDAPGELRVPLSISICPFNGNVVIATLSKIVIYENNGGFVQEIGSGPVTGHPDFEQPGCGETGRLLEPGPGYISPVVPFRFGWPCCTFGQGPRGVHVADDGCMYVVTSDVLCDSCVVVLQSRQRTTAL